MSESGQDLGAMQAKWLGAVSASASIETLEQVRVDALGKKGEISALMKGLGGLPPEEPTGLSVPEGMDPGPGEG